jgi:hypothetical protein
VKKTPIGQDISDKRLVSDTKLPTPLRQVKENSLHLLCMQLNEMFTSCDDLFFDLSGRASSNSEQNLYFESMREIRLKKSGLMAGFQREYERSFHELAGPAAAKPANGQPFSGNTLSLVENDQLEQKVAISGMITKCRANLQEELYHLNCRFDFLIPGKQIDEQSNPLDPQQICAAFAKAAEILDLNIKARIILYKQFDRFVISRLGKVYNQANDWLINAGVLPKIRSAIRKAADEGIYDTGQNGAVSGAEVANHMVGLNELRSLLSELRAVGLSVPSVVAIIPGYNPAAPTISRNELMGGLAQAQVHPQQLDATVTELDIRSAIRQILIKSGHHGQPKSVPPVEEDIINLVAMFFDFVLDDPNVPVQIQALLSRLQIPVLKIALHDRRFFNDNKHPARLLINEIAGASIGWSSLQQHAQDQLYEKISATVQQIHDNFIDDTAVFTEQYEILKAYLEQENRKTSLVEKRASEAAVGQATTNHVRALVRNLLEERCAGRSIPLDVHRFLFDQWQGVLFLLYIKEGERSASWLDGCQIVDDLIWTVTPHQDEKSQQRLAQMIEPLFARISQKLQLTAVSITELEAALATLRSVHQRIRDGLHTELQYIKADSPVIAAAAAASNSVTITASNAVDTASGKPWESMTAIERQQVQTQRLQFEFIQKAEKLPIGTWIEFSHIDGEPGPLRFKLTAKIDLTDSFVFVNRFGTKIVDKSRKAFAADLQQNIATVLERGSAFDRAISRIATNLREIKAA